MRKKTMLVWGVLLLFHVGRHLITQYLDHGDAWKRENWPTRISYALLVGVIFELGRYSQRVDPDPVT